MRVLRVMRTGVNSGSTAIRCLTWEYTAGNAFPPLAESAGNMAPGMPPAQTTMAARCAMIGAIRRGKRPGTSWHANGLAGFRRPDQPAASPQAKGSPIMSPRTLTTAQALRARAGRAHEDPAAMTLDALLGRLARYAVAIIRKNPDLDDAAVAKGARLLLRAEMAERAEQSKAARAAASAVSTGTGTA